MRWGTLFLQYLIQKALEPLALWAAEDFLRCALLGDIAVIKEENSV